MVERCRTHNIMNSTSWDRKFFAEVTSRTGQAEVGKEHLTSLSVFRICPMGPFRSPKRNHSCVLNKVPVEVKARTSIDQDEPTGQCALARLLPVPLLLLLCSWQRERHP